jgi:hypothetical protein
VLALDSPQELLSAFAAPELSVWFDREGHFLGTEEPESTQALELLDALPLNAEQKEQVRQSVSGVLEDVAREHWEQRVGRWNGRWLVPGAPLRSKTKMWVGQHMLDREEIEAEERTTLELSVPCTEGAQERRCVRVVVETVPVRQFRKSEPCERARGLKRFELVTEPDTLLPHRTLAVREYEMDSCEEDGTVFTRKTRVVEQFVFTYGVERPYREHARSEAALSREASKALLRASPRSLEDMAEVVVQVGRARAVLLWDDLETRAQNLLTEVQIRARVGSHAPLEAISSQDA